MVHKLHNFRPMFLIIVIPVLFSCAGVDANSYHHLGIIHMQRGDLDEAILYFNKAIELDPKSLIAYSDRGEAYAAKGEYDRAISDYTTHLR